MKMSGPSPRNGNRFSKTPPFLIPGLLVVVVILSFNYWRTSRLNKELLESVAHANNLRQKIGHDLKDSEMRIKEKMAEENDLKTKLTQLGNEFEQHKKTVEEKEKQQRELVDGVQSELDRLKADHTDLQDRHSKLVTEHNQLKENSSEKLSSVNNKVTELQRAAASLNETAERLSEEKLKMLNFVSEELGKDGVESLQSLGVQLHKDFQMPPGDQKGLCTRRAEEACNANIAKNQLALYQNKIASHEINSPNANVEQVRSEQKVVTSGRETPSEGVAPSVGNAGEKLAGGESAPLAGGEGAPLAGGEGAPLAGGEGAPLAGGEGAPLAGGEGAPLAAGVQQLEPQGQDAAADTLQVGDEENTKNRDTVAVDTLTSPDNKEEMKGEAELDKDKVEEGPDQITPHPVKADDKTSLMNDVTDDNEEDIGDEMRDDDDGGLYHGKNSDGVNEVPAQTDDDGTTPLDLEGLGKVTVKGDS